MEAENDPHLVDENPEDHIGDEIFDPWEDDEQTDWPSGSIELPEVSE